MLIASLRQGWGQGPKLVMSNGIGYGHEEGQLSQESVEHLAGSLSWQRGYNIILLNEVLIPSEAIPTLSLLPNLPTLLLSLCCDCNEFPPIILQTSEARQIVDHTSWLIINAMMVNLKTLFMQILLLYLSSDLHIFIFCRPKSPAVDQLSSKQSLAAFSHLSHLQYSAYFKQCRDFELDTTTDVKTLVTYFMHRLKSTCMTYVTGWSARWSFAFVKATQHTSLKYRIASHMANWKPA